ncbi:DUF6631 family protein [Lysobacter olei]
MARKAPKAAPDAVEPSSAASDLSALQPDVAITIAGRKLTIREYAFFEGLEVADRAAAFITDMHAQCADGSLTYARVRRLFGKHQTAVVAIAAQAADVELEWLQGLSPSDAELFMSTWFAVNSGFFVHELVVEMQVQRRSAQPSSTGLASSPASPPPGSATSTDSPDSPNAS